jgi:hypothetical protein
MAASGNKAGETSASQRALAGFLVLGGYVACLVAVEAIAHAKAASLWREVASYLPFSFGLIGGFSGAVWIVIRLIQIWVARGGR